MSVQMHPILMLYLFSFDWQDPMFFAMSAYIYRIDEGLQFFALQSGIAERNANELRRADHEVHDIADGRYDG